MSDNKPEVFLRATVVALLTLALWIAVSVFWIGFYNWPIREKYIQLSREVQVGQYTLYQNDAGDCYLVRTVKGKVQPAAMWKQCDLNQYSVMPGLTETKPAVKP